MDNFEAQPGQVWAFVGNQFGKSADERMQEYLHAMHGVANDEKIHMVDLAIEILEFGECIRFKVLTVKNIFNWMGS